MTRSLKKLFSNVKMSFYPTAATLLQGLAILGFLVGFVILLVMAIRSSNKEKERVKKKNKKVQAYNEKVDALDVLPNKDFNEDHPDYDETISDAERDRQACMKLDGGTNLFHKQFKIQRLPVDVSYAVKGATPKFGVSFSCKPTPTGCQSDTIRYDFNLKNDDFYVNPRSSESYSAFGNEIMEKYNKNENGYTTGITAQEALAECYKSSVCGTVVLPVCEPGFLHVSQQNLENLLAGEDIFSKSGDFEKWLETDKFFSKERGIFTNAACVRVNEGAVNATIGKTAQAVDESMKEYLDFSDVRALNYDHLNEDKIAPARIAHYYPKSKKAITTKVRSSRENVYTFKNGDMNSSGHDGFVLQYWSGHVDRAPDKDLAAYNTICEKVNNSLPDEIRAKCRTALENETWEMVDCGVRASKKRQIGPSQ